MISKYALYLFVSLGNQGKKLTSDVMSVFFIRFNPDELLAGMQDLWFIADPRRAREQDIATKNIK